MSSKIVEPPLRTPHPDDSSDDLPAATRPSDREKGPSLRPASGPNSGPYLGGPGTASADDLGLSLSDVSPDPLLGEFAPDLSGPEGSAPQSFRSTGAGALEGIDLDVPPSASGEVPAVASVSSGVSAVV